MKVSRETMENKQIALYFIALAFALLIGWNDPSWGAGLSTWLDLIIAILLFGMFSQIPFLQLRKAWGNRTFMYALLLVNYIFNPVVVWLLAHIVPNHPPILLGVYLVLLTPCIDYVIVFTYLGRGNEKLMLAATPLLFVTQMVLLPVYLWLLLGAEAAQIVQPGPFLAAFFKLILLPLTAALLVQGWAAKQATGRRVLEGAAWLPVPFMALTLFTVVVSQMSNVHASLGLIVKVLPVYVLFMVIMPFIARQVAFWLRIETGAARALVFSSGTRNSLVVLPLALSLPAGTKEIVAAVIVAQTLVEIVLELVYIRVIPAWVIPDIPKGRTSKTME